MSTKLKNTISETTQAYQVYMNYLNQLQITYMNFQTQLDSAFKTLEASKLSLPLTSAQQFFSKISTTAPNFYYLSSFQEEFTKLQAKQGKFSIWADQTIKDATNYRKALKQIVFKIQKEVLQLSKPAVDSSVSFQITISKFYIEFKAIATNSRELIQTVSKKIMKSINYIDKTVKKCVNQMAVLSSVESLESIPTQPDSLKILLDAAENELDITKILQNYIIVLVPPVIPTPNQQLNHLVNYFELDSEIQHKTSAKIKESFATTENGKRIDFAKDEPVDLIWGGYSKLWKVQKPNRKNVYVVPSELVEII